jgi:2,5-diketo-D-gluconate reductase B
MPRLGLGTWPMKGAECRRAVEAALALGYRHIDTAEMYGNEADVGAAIAASGLPRDALFVTTKVWHDHLTPPGIRAACEASLARLRLDRADLYHVHWPNPAMDLDAVMGAMVRLKEDGLARVVGVCNFPPGLLRRALGTGAPISCVQVEHHVYLSQERLLALTRPAGIPLTSYTPTAKGAGEKDPVLQGIARKHGRTPTQVALAWLLGQDGVAAIPKAAKEANQRANLEAVSLRLDDEDRAAIAALPKDRRLVDPGFVSDWNA